MEILVTGYSDAPSGLIDIQTPHGPLRGRWGGASPRIGGTYQVELSLPYPLQWQQDLIEVAPQAPACQLSENQLHLIAQVESLPDEGLLYLRLGLSLILAEVLCGAPSVGKMVQLTVDLQRGHLAIYDSGM